MNRQAKTSATRHPRHHGLAHGAQVVVLALLFNLVLDLAALSPHSRFRGEVMAAGPAKAIKLVAFGDSLTAGYLLPPGDAFPAQLERALKARGHAVEVVNAGVSGDTTSGGLERLAWALPEDVDAVIVELGANDMLRALDPAIARANLDRILAAIAARKADVLLAGMRATRNLGEGYVASFDPIFPELAAKHGALLYPFFLATIALRPELNLADGLHPNARGVAAIVADILPKVEELLARVAARRRAAGQG